MKERRRSTTAENGRWLLLIHQIPPKPDYLRVKIGRRLTKIGAVPIKNSVYAMPRGESAHEDLEWVLREISAGGGDAYVCEARFVEGLDDGQVEDLFRAARDAEYAAIAEEARAVAKRIPRAKRLVEAARADLVRDVERLRRQVSDVAAIDFFGASGREAVDGIIAALEERLAPEPVPIAAPPRESYRGRTWITRRGIHVDRIATAWLVRRFIDPKARFRFVDPKSYRHRAGEVRFDMFDAEFTHEGDACSFEVVLARLGPKDAALRAIADVVHDLDLKDGKHGREETSGIAAAIHGLCWSKSEDGDRLAAGASLFDALYEFFRRSAAPKERDG